MNTTQPANSRQNVVSELSLVWWFVFPAVGAAVLWGLLPFSAWVAQLAWAPLQGPFALVASIPQPGAAIGAVALGSAAGLVLAYVAHTEGFTATVSPSRVELSRGSRVHDTVAGEEVHLVFMDGKELVLLSREGAELARQATDLKPAALRPVFVAHGYSWNDAGDPYLQQYTRWVPGGHGLPDGADALLHARQSALESGDKADVVELRRELWKLDVVVRDSDKKQYWRTARQSNGD